MLKGPVLGRVLYRADEHREYMDADVMVAPSDLDRAREVLGGLGYARSDDRGVDDFLGVLHAETWYRRIPDGALVDLHWRLAGCAASPERAWAELYGDHEEIDLGGCSVEVLGRPALALHLGTHAAQHGPDDKKALGDLAKGLERWPEEDWRHAARLAEKLTAVEAFAAGLRLHPEGAAMARALGLPDAPETSWTVQHSRSRPRGTFHLEALVEAQGIRERAKVLRKSLLPRREWIIWTYPPARNSRIKLLRGYLRHLSRAPLWAFRAWQFRRNARRAGR